MREIIRRQEIRETLTSQIQKFVRVAKQQQRLTFLLEENPRLVAQAKQRRDAAMHTAKVYREVLEAN